MKFWDESIHACLECYVFARSHLNLFGCYDNSTTVRYLSSSFRFLDASFRLEFTSTGKKHIFLVMSHHDPCWKRGFELEASIHGYRLIINLCISHKTFDLQARTPPHINLRAKGVCKSYHLELNF
jgi:hypothetical protein